MNGMPYRCYVSIITVLTDLQNIDDLIKEYNKFKGFSCEFILFCKGIDPVEARDTFKSKCNIRIFLKEAKEDDTYEYLMEYGGGQFLLRLEERSEFSIDRENLEQMLDAMDINKIKTFEKDHKIMIVNREGTKEINVDAYTTPTNSKIQIENLKIE